MTLAMINCFWQRFCNCHSFPVTFMLCSSILNRLNTTTQSLKQSMEPTHSIIFATACVLHVQIYKERKNLAYTLQDARGVVSKLELIMGVMMHVLFVFFYLIIFDVSRTWLSHSVRDATVQSSQHYIAHAMLFQLMWHTPCRMTLCCESPWCCEATCSRIAVKRICKGLRVTPACISTFRR